VTLLVLYLKLPQAAWPAYGSVYLCAVALVAVISGWKDAVVSLVVGALLLDYFFVGPVNSFSLPSSDDWAVFLCFVLSGILVAVAIEWRRASEKRLKTGIHLAQAQMDLAEARAVMGIREASGMAGQRESLPGAARQMADRMEEVAEGLDRSAREISRLPDGAPADAVASLRQQAARIGELAIELRAVAGGARGGASTKGNRGEPTRSQ
jgi:K+-sensing histidine kinase KdpD